MAGRSDTEVRVLNPHTSKIIVMKYKVIKEYAGIEVGSEVKLSESNAKYMIERGYVESINHTAPETKAKNAENKAIEPKYKRNKK